MGLCQGCKLAINPAKSVCLPGGWSVNHYGGSEGFFGWLALQTAKHRCTLRDLVRTEVEALGPNLRRLESGIYKYWENRGRPVSRVYVMYFLEGQLEAGHDWHFHVHVVPRFERLKRPMGKPHKPDEIDAYQIAKLSHILPSFLDRSAFEKRHGEPRRIREDRRILDGVVRAAGFSRAKKRGPKGK